MIKNEKQGNVRVLFWLFPIDINFLVFEQNWGWQTEMNPTVVGFYIPIFWSLQSSDDEVSIEVLGKVVGVSPTNKIGR